MEFAINKSMFIDNKKCNKQISDPKHKSEKDKLIEEKRDLTKRLENKKFKYAKNEKQKE